MKNKTSVLYSLNKEKATAFYLLMVIALALTLNRLYAFNYFTFNWVFGSIFVGFIVIPFLIRMFTENLFQYYVTYYWWDKNKIEIENRLRDTENLSEEQRLALSQAIRGVLNGMDQTSKHSKLDYSIHFYFIGLIIGMLFFELVKNPINPF